MALIYFVGGGSVGHIAPSVAVWEALKVKRPDAEALFLCADRPDDRAFLTAHGLPFEVLSAPRASLALVWTLPRAIMAASRLLSRRRPAVIFSKGGYVSLPLCLAAWLHRIPIVLHESDTVRGRANRLIGLLARHVCLGLTDERSGTRSTVTGNPVRAEIVRGARERGLALTGFSGQRPILLVIGGSQGSQALNEAIITNIDALTAVCDVIHITGHGKETIVKQAGYWQAPFLAEELAHVYACTNMSLSRAGAGVIGELAANGIAMMLCPLRDVGHDHQQYNADTVLAGGGCIVIQQTELSARLVSTVAALAASAEQRQILANNLRTFHHPDAAVHIAEIIAEHLGS